MFNFVQYKPNKKERWVLVSATQVFETPPAFRTVLSVSSNPDDARNQGMDPLKVVKYQGPMYFDLDGVEISKVLESAKVLIKELESRYSVKPEFLRCYLSGKKGVHITFPQALFGSKSAAFMLPLIYGKFADAFPGEYIDRGVYSAGKGRMWRCEGVKRPDSGTYKVEVTAQELLGMDEEEYHKLVAEPRPSLEYDEPKETIPELDSFFRLARDQVRKEADAKAKAVNLVTHEDLADLTEIPGCIDTLITQGDCPESNWNQAAMQLATYIAARYQMEEKEEYEEQLVEPFLINVESSGRPTVEERRTEFKNMMHRAWTGSIKFSSGGIIAAIGTPCRSCVICSKKDKMQQVAEDEYYDNNTKQKLTKDGIYVVGENSQKKVGNFTLTPEAEYMTTNDFNQLVQDATLYLVEVEGRKTNIVIEEDAFLSRKSFNEALKGSGAAFLGTDNDSLSLGVTLTGLKRSLETPQMVRTKISGIQYVDVAGKLYPHLVTKSHSYAKGNTPSNLQYIGNERWAPDFESVPSFETQDDLDGLEKAFSGLLNMNENRLIMPILGWIAATHLKQHLNHIGDQFPLLNVCGGSHSGKSSTMFLMNTLNGFPYRKCTTWNAETSTSYPLEEMIGSTTTFVRMIEEANEANAKRNWSKLVGILKSSWDGVEIMKGGIVGKQVVSTFLENTAPLVYLSEQGFPIQSIRTRSIVCFFKPDGVENPVYKANHDTAVQYVKYLEMMAKVLTTVSLNLNLSKLRQWREEAYKDVPRGYTGRTQTIYGTVFLGLKFLTEIMETYSSNTVDMLIEKKNELIQELEGTVDEVNKEKRHSATDDILIAFDNMASDPENLSYGLECGRHYWRKGSMVHFDIRQCFPRFRRYARGIGQDNISITTDLQLKELLEAEPYFEAPVQQHPHRAGVEIHVINLDKLRAKGTVLTNLQEGEPE